MDSNYQKLTPGNSVYIIKPVDPKEKTSSGLVIPTTVQLNEPLVKGWIVRAHEGQKFPNFKQVDTQIYGDDGLFIHIPPPFKEGELAYYRQHHKIEFEYNNETLVVVNEGDIMFTENVLEDD